MENGVVGVVGVVIRTKKLYKIRRFWGAIPTTPTCARCSNKEQICVFLRLLSPYPHFGVLKILSNRVFYGIWLKQKLRWTKIFFWRFYKSKMRWRKRLLSCIKRKSAMRLRSKTMGDNKSNVLVSIMIEKAGMDIIS